MDLIKNMKAGYQGMRDAMRIKADKLMNHPGHAKDVYPSKSAADKDKMRPYKEGGSVMKKDGDCMMKKGGSMMKEDEQMKERRRMDRMMKERTKAREDHMMECKKSDVMKKGKPAQKFAMGGVAKIRHDEATDDGMPTKPKKKSVRELM